MTTPLERRDWFVGVGARKAQALGIGISTDHLQRQWAADLTLVDNLRASGELRHSYVKKKMTAAEVLAEKRALKAEAQAAKIGGRIRHRALPAKDKPKRGFVLTGVEAQKLHAIVARIHLVGQRARTIRAGEDLEHGFQYGSLARRFAEAQTNHDAKRGEYAGKSDWDRWRIYFATLQKICDDSNAVCGFGWWVKR